MSMLKQTIKTGMIRGLGEARAEQVLRVYRRGLVTAAYHLHPDGIPSRKRLASMRNAFAGKRCFIIGNGPSLRRTNLALLKNEITFGLNRIYLIFEELGFTTSFLVSMNPYVIEQFSDDILRLPMPKFLSWQAHGAIGSKRSDVTYLVPSPTVMFSTRPEAVGIWEGATVTYAAMQLAYHMGFEQVVLVGVDHSFQTQGTPHKLVVSEGPDPNHFSPAYFGSGVRWQLPDLETSEIAYRMAKEQFERDGRSIVDATVGGQLDVFPRGELEGLLKAA